MTIKEKLELAIANKDWGLVEELTKSLDAPKPKKVVKKKTAKKKVAPKKAPVKRARGPSVKDFRVVDHQKWHNDHRHAPVAIPDRPNKFAPEDHPPKKFIVPHNSPKFAGKTFPSEEAYLKAAGLYSKPVPRPKNEAKKISATCSACGRTQKLYPSEIIVYDDAKFRCERCILNNKSGVSSRDEDED